MLDISLVGLGKMGISYIDNIIESPDLNVIGLCDTNSESVDVALDKFTQTKPPGFTNYQEMLKQTNPNLVIIATPTDSHFNFLKEAIEKDNNVLIEKPVCLTSEEADQLEKISISESQRIAVGYLTRYSPVIEEAKKFITAFNLQPHHIDIRWIKDRRGQRKHFGVIGQEATHPLDLMLHSLIDYETIQLPDSILTNKIDEGDYETDSNFYLKVDEVTIECAISFVKTTSKRHISIYCRRPDNDYEYRIVLAFDKKHVGNYSIDRMAIYDTEKGKWSNWSQEDGFELTLPGNFKEYPIKKLQEQVLAIEKWITSGEYNPKICTLEQAIRNVRLCEEIKKRPQMEFKPFSYK